MKWRFTIYCIELIKVAISNLLDALPPYQWIEGFLVEKEIRHGGHHYLLINEEMVQVDPITFETLMVGEALRIRCTRRYKAISIDRLIP